MESLIVALLVALPGIILGALFGFFERESDSPDPFDVPFGDVPGEGR